MAASIFVDLSTVLRSHGMHAEADYAAERLQAAAQQTATRARPVSREEELQQACQETDLCFDLLQTACCGKSQPQGVTDLHRRLWARNVEAIKELQQLNRELKGQVTAEGTAASAQALHAENRVLRANMRSLKQTVQTLLGDVSTLLHHHAAQGKAQPVGAPTAPLLPLLAPPSQAQPPSTAALSKQRAQGDGRRTSSSSSRRPVSISSLAAMHGPSRIGTGARAASAPPAPAAAVSPEPHTRTVSSSSHFAATLQHLIQSIEKLSTQFAHCQAGRLIESSSSSGTSFLSASSGGSEASSTRGSNSSSTVGRVLPPAAAARRGSSQGAIAGPGGGGNRLRAHSSSFLRSSTQQLLDTQQAKAAADAWFLSHSTGSLPLAAAQQQQESAPTEAPAGGSSSAKGHQGKQTEVHKAPAESAVLPQPAGPAQPACEPSSATSTQQQPAGVRPSVPMAAPKAGGGVSGSSTGSRQGAAEPVPTDKAAGPLTSGLLTLRRSAQSLAAAAKPSAGGTILPPIPTAAAATRQQRMAAEAEGPGSRASSRCSNPGGRVSSSSSNAHERPPLVLPSASEAATGTGPLHSGRSPAAAGPLQGGSSPAMAAAAASALARHGSLASRSSLGSDVVLLGSCNPDAGSQVSSPAVGSVASQTASPAPPGAAADAAGGGNGGAHMQAAADELAGGAEQQAHKAGARAARALEWSVTQPRSAHPPGNGKAATDAQQVPAAAEDQQQQPVCPCANVGLDPAAEQGKACSGETEGRPTAAAAAPYDEDSSEACAPAAATVDPGASEPAAGRSVLPEPPAAAQEGMRDAVRPGREDSPTKSRRKSASPQDTAAGRDNRPHHAGSSSKAGAVKQQPAPAAAVTEATEAAAAPQTGSPGSSNKASSAGSASAAAQQRPSHKRRWSLDGASTSTAASPADASLASQSLDSQGAMQLLGAGFSREASAEVDSSASAASVSAAAAGRGPHATDATAAAPAATEGRALPDSADGAAEQAASSSAAEPAAGAEGAGAPADDAAAPVEPDTADAGGREDAEELAQPPVCQLALQDLLAVVLDVLHDKQAADARRQEAGQPRVPLALHLKQYAASKVAGDPEAFAKALSAILCGVQQYAAEQPEIAVFSKVLSNQLHEDFFFSTHLNLRRRLQQLAVNAVLQGTPRLQRAKPRARGDVWAHSCSALLQPHQLQWLLSAWARPRALVLGQARQAAGTASPTQLAAAWDAAIRHHSGCGPDDGVRAGGVVAALLLWELQQAVAHLQPLAQAFAAADAAGTGLLSFEGFQLFCAQLNGAMRDEEVQVLFEEELDPAGHGHVSFTAVCRALLPAMRSASV